MFDPLSPYQSSFDEIAIDKINQGIIIDNVEEGIITKCFLKQLISMRIKTPAFYFSYSDLYEIVLS